MQAMTGESLFHPTPMQPVTSAYGDDVSAEYSAVWREHQSDVADGIKDFVARWLILETQWGGRRSL